MPDRMWIYSPQQLITGYGRQVLVGLGRMEIQHLNHQTSSHSGMYVLFEHENWEPWKCFWGLGSLGPLGSYQRISSKMWYVWDSGVTKSTIGGVTPHMTIWKEWYPDTGWPVGFYRISTTKQKTRISTKYRPHSTLSTKYRPQNFLKKRILSKLNCPWCNMMCHVLRFICMLSKGCHPVWFVVVCCSFDWDWANL